MHGSDAAAAAAAGSARSKLRRAMTSFALLVAVAVVLAVVAVLVAFALFRIAALRIASDAVAREMSEARTRVDVVAAQSADMERDLKQDFANARAEQAAAAQAARTEFGAHLAQLAQTLQQQLATGGAAQVEQLREIGGRVLQLTHANDQRLEAVRATVEEKLEALRAENAWKLEQMRATVDEKLQSTLEARLGESFKQVSERLEQVHRGLGEMQNLAAGVGDLKRVLGNVKTRGGWGEVQLAALLDEMLTPQQYERNVETRRGSGERVEFAIRLPGRSDDGAPCWLPIDAKFPLDDWQRLQDALDRADVNAADAARKALADFLRVQARTIRDKYVEPPQTTDFAILFVPTEGLYAEVMARPGFADALQRDFRILLTGPTNLAALLNSLQMGFRTLAIEQRSSEVWRVLGAVKTEFAKFGEVLARTKDRIDKASEELERAGVRRRALERQLRTVDALPEPDAAKLIGDGAPLEGDELPGDR
jgi:DNA recombination protein RmuC